MQTTEKLTLQKPSYDDDADMVIVNANMDIIDDAINKLDREKVGVDALPQFAHFHQSTVSETGAHDLRYYGNVLQAYVDGSWIAVSSQNDGLQEQVNKNTADIKVLWDAVFSNITTNPFRITFQDLDGITVKSGVWNDKQARLEC